MTSRLWFLNTINVPEPKSPTQRSRPFGNIVHHPFMTFWEVYPSLWMWNPARRIFYTFTAASVVDVPPCRLVDNNLPMISACNFAQTTLNSLSFPAPIPWPSKYYIHILKLKVIKKFHSYFIVTRT